MLTASRQLSELLAPEPCQTPPAQMATEPAGITMSCTSSSGSSTNASDPGGYSAHRCEVGTILVAPFSSVKSWRATMELQTSCFAKGRWNTEKS